MQIIISKLDNDSVQLDFQKADWEEAMSFDEVIETLITAFDGVLREFLSTAPKNNWKFRESVYDQMDYLFDQLLSKVFPEIKPNDFNLTAAAMVYAQDKMIEEAANEGISYKEMLKRYEQRAKDYIINRDKLS